MAKAKRMRPVAANALIFNGILILEPKTKKESCVFVSGCAYTN